MKSYFIPLLFISLLLFSFHDAEAQKKKKKKKGKQAETEMVEEKPLFNNLIDSVSYVIGREVGENLKMISSDMNVDIISLAIREAFEGKESIFSVEESDSCMNIFQEYLVDLENESNRGEIDMNKEAGNKFLAENKLREEVTELPSGLQYEVLEEGDGAKPTAKDEVTVHYKGMLIDGTVFDSSYERNETITFGLGNVIKGWTEGLQLMNTGSKYVFYIPPQLGYGDRAVGPIPAGSTLIFEVELFSF